MQSHPNLLRVIAPGDIIKPWLMLGPFYEDLSARVQGLTFFERPFSGVTVGQSAMLEVMEDARSILLSKPVEGQVSQFRGKTAGWTLVRSPEQYLSWGTYNISNHLGAAFVSSLISPEAAGRRKLTLYCRIYLRAVVYINGVNVFDSDTCQVKSKDGVYIYPFEADLQAGENLVTIGLFRVARMAQVGFRLEVEDCAVQAHVPTALQVPEAVRTALEKEVGSLRLASDVFYPGQSIGFKLGSAAASADPRSEIKLQVQLVSDTGEILKEVTPTGEGLVEVGPAEEIEDGHLFLVATWSGPDGVILTQVTFAIHKVSPVQPPVGIEHLEKRKLMVLEHYANNREREVHGIWTQVARYARGEYERIDLSVIRKTCEFINARKDCSDFVIQGILRLMYWERDSSHLSPEINAMMKDTVLNFKYWVDEPGDTVMYMGSENHRFLFHVAEWLAGHLYPVDIFTNSGQNGLYHTQKAYMYITEWLRQRGRFGFDEWHSNSYYPICIAPLINLYDFSTHEGYYKLRQMTAAILDQMLFYMASDSYQGIFGTTHGRSYGIYVKYPDFEGTSALNWLYLATGSLSKTTSGMAPVCAATSTYQPPRILVSIANDQKQEVEMRRRQGILRTSAHHADFVVYRTPDYLLSGLQDHRKGEFESSTHVGQVTLGNKNVIFWSCPHTIGEGSGLRPDYWSGSTTLPRLVQHRNIMALTWRLTKYAWMSHCLFEKEKFDEVRSKNGWMFARVADGYVALTAIDHNTGLVDVVEGEDGQYAGRELQCKAPEHTWVIECGRRAGWGSFDAFVEAIAKARLEVKDGVVNYDSPSAGLFVTGWDVAPSVKGETLQLHGYPMVGGGWAEAAFGSGEMKAQYEGEIEEWWFNQ